MTETAERNYKIVQANDGTVAVEQSAPSVMSFACSIPALERLPRRITDCCTDWMVAGNGNFSGLGLAARPTPPPAKPVRKLPRPSSGTGASTPTGPPSNGQK